MGEGRRLHLAPLQRRLVKIDPALDRDGTLPCIFEAQGKMEVAGSGEGWMIPEVSVTPTCRVFLINSASVRIKISRGFQSDGFADPAP